MDNHHQRGSSSKRYSWFLTMFRIELFQRQDQDKFLPHYKFDMTLPEIPVRPKFFTYKLNHKLAAEYELS